MTDKEKDQLIKDYEMLTRRLIRRIERHDPDDKIIEQTRDFLARKAAPTSFFRTTA